MEVIASVNPEPLKTAARLAEPPKMLWLVEWLVKQQQQRKKRGRKYDETGTTRNEFG